MKKCIKEPKRLIIYILALLMMVSVVAPVVEPVQAATVKQQSASSSVYSVKRKNGRIYCYRNRKIVKKVGWYAVSSNGKVKVRVGKKGYVDYRLTTVKKNGVPVRKLYKWNISSHKWSVVKNTWFQIGTTDYYFGKTGKAALYYNRRTKVFTKYSGKKLVRVSGETVVYRNGRAKKRYFINNGKVVRKAGVYKTTGNKFVIVSSSGKVTKISTTDPCNHKWVALTEKKKVLVKASWYENIFEDSTKCVYCGNDTGKDGTHTLDECSRWSVWTNKIETPFVLWDEPEVIPYKKLVKTIFHPEEYEYRTVITGYKCSKCGRDKCEHDWKAQTVTKKTIVTDGWNRETYEHRVQCAYCRRDTSSNLHDAGACGELVWDPRGGVWQPEGAADIEYTKLIKSEFIPDTYEYSKIVTGYKCTKCGAEK